MLQYYNKTFKDHTFQQIPSLKEGCWIHVEEAVAEDLQQISALTGLEQSDLVDALDKYEVPRIEKRNSNILIFIRHPEELESGLYTSTLALILAPHYFISISPTKSSLTRAFLENVGKYSTLQKSKLLIALLHRLTHEFTIHIRKVRHLVLHQEKEISSVDSQDVADMTKNEEILNQYLAALLPMRSVLEKMINGKYSTLYEKEQELLIDLLNAVKQSEDLCDISVKSMRNLRDSYQIIFTNNVTRTIKLLTALTILFSIPTTIASIYGMNIALPLADKPQAFVYILGVSSASVVLGALIFQQKKWL